MAVAVAVVVVVVVVVQELLWLDFPKRFYNLSYASSKIIGGSVQHVRYVRMTSISVAKSSELKMLRSFGFGQNEGRKKKQGDAAIIISKYYGTSTPKGSYSAKTGESTR